MGLLIDQMFPFHSFAVEMRQPMNEICEKTSTLFVPFSLYLSPQSTRRSFVPFVIEKGECWSKGHVVYTGRHVCVSSCVNVIVAVQVDDC